VRTQIYFFSKFKNPSLLLLSTADFASEQGMSLRLTPFNPCPSPTL
jgi:hypothetical protein